MDGPALITRLFMGLITTSTRDILELKTKQPKSVRDTMVSILNETPRGKFWVAAHDGVKVLTSPFLSDGITKSGNRLICADTEAECLTEIKRLGLKELPKETVNNL